MEILHYLPTQNRRSDCATNDPDKVAQQVNQGLRPIAEGASQHHVYDNPQQFAQNIPEEKPRPRIEGYAWSD
jgi:hypothetical protein